jgi:hypothetical protein
MLVRSPSEIAASPPRLHRAGDAATMQGGAMGTTVRCTQVQTAAVMVDLVPAPLTKRGWHATPVIVLLAAVDRLFPKGTIAYCKVKPGCSLIRAQPTAQPEHKRTSACEHELQVPVRDQKIARIIRNWTLSG